MKPTNVVLTPAQRTTLKRIAFKTGQTVSALVRAAVDAMYGKGAK